MSSESSSNHNKKTSRPLQFLGGITPIILAIIFLYFALRGVDFSLVVSSIQKINLLYLLIAVVIIISSYTLRGLRWHILLNQESKLPPIASIAGVWAGYLGNNFLPARAGELIRSSLISLRYKLSFSYIIATIFSERVADAIFLGCIMLALIPQFSFIPDWMLNGARALLLMGIISVVLLPMVYLIRQRLLQFIETKLAKTPIWKKFQQILNQFLLGLTVLFNPRKAFIYLSMLLLVWFADMAFAQMIALAFNKSLSIQEAFLLLAALGLSSSIPSTPGSIGIWQFVAVAVLVPLGWEQSTAIAFILIFQLCLYGTTAIFGSLGFWFLSRGLGTQFFEAIRTSSLRT